jgi:hypothetical protein
MHEPYIPLFKSVVRSSLWSLDAETIKVFLTVCAEADSEGYCSASIDGIRRIADVSIDSCRSALDTLCSADEYSKDLERGADGRRLEKVQGGWRVVNLTWYQEAARKEAERARKARWWKENKGRYRLPSQTPADESESAPATADVSAVRKEGEVETQVEVEAPLRERDPDRARTNPTHVFVVPDGEPPKPYLDAAVMAGVTAERAKETWEYWRDAGLPAGGVRNLFGWLVGKAKLRAKTAPAVNQKPSRGMFGQAPRQPDCGLTGFENVEEYK